MSDSSSSSDEAASGRAHYARGPTMNPTLPKTHRERLATRVPSEETSSKPPAEDRGASRIYGPRCPWEKLANVVRGYDEDKVKNALEDLDGLQKMAGIFCVVITGFLVGSSRRLAQDTTEQILFTTRNIYIVELAIYRHMEFQTLNNNAVLSSMSNVNTSTGPSKPSSSDTRVNALWYSALILSLAIVSLSLLVKQWLRVYLSVETASPRPRLRVRHLRHPELERWHVFKLVEVLPFLQQLAFALFFAGLCCFTGSMDQEIGRASYTLIVGWTFSISTASLLPMFFPRCPYQTPLLKPLLYSCHMGAVGIAHAILRRLSAWHITAPYDSIRDRAFRWTFTWLMALDAHVGRTSESVIMIAERADMEILLELDREHANDEMLKGTIRACLMDLQPSLEDVVQFVLRILQHRMPLDIPMQDGRLMLRTWKPAPLDLRTLPKTVYTTTVDIIAKSLATGILRNVRSSRALDGWRRSKETTQALYILFSPSRWTLPTSAVNLLNELLSYQGTDLIRMLGHECPYSIDAVQDKFYLLLSSLSHSVDQLDLDVDFALQSFEALLQIRFEDASRELKFDSAPGHSNVRFSVLSDFEALPWAKTMSYGAHTEAARVIIQIASRAVRRRQEQSLSVVAPTTVPDVLVDSIVGMWSMAVMAKIEERSHTLQLQFRNTVNECLATPEATFALLQALGRTKTKFVVHSQKKWRAPPFGPWLLHDDAREKLQNLSQAITRLSSTSLADEASNPRLNLTRAVIVCYAAISMLAISDAASPSEGWQAVFNGLERLGTKALTGSSESPIPMEIKEMAQDCLVSLRAKAFGGEDDMAGHDPQGILPTLAGRNFDDEAAIVEDKDTGNDSRLKKMLESVVLLYEFNT